MDPLWILLMGMCVVIGGILVLRLHAFLALILGAIVVAALTPTKSLERYALEKKMPAPEAVAFAQKSVGERIAPAFGSTCGSIGILIALASIIGKCLMDSGCADRIVRWTLRLLGHARCQLAFLASGYLLGIPIFFDTVFLLMIPLGKAMWMRTKQNYLLYVLAIIAGATMTHSLVPPTPGPLFVASELKVNLGIMILAGCIVGGFTSLAGFLFATWVNQRLEIPVRESGQTSLAELEKLAQYEESELPPLWLSLMPIVLPVVLIGGNAFLQTAWSKPDPTQWEVWQRPVLRALETLGNSNIAIALSCAVALGTLAWQKKQHLAQLASSVQNALADGGLIILITAAGGAFGGMLQQSGIGPRILELSQTYQIGILPLAFTATALVRIAQGSATVAMITGVGIVSGVATPEQLGFHPVYLALAIGCGSKPIPWMNDSGFWVVCKMSGMTEKETLKTHSPMATLMGITGLLVTILLARIFPMV